MRSAAALALVALCSLAAPALADLDADVARVRKLVENERWKDGAAAVQQLFADHEGDAAVRGHLKTLEEDLKLCLFREQAGKVSGRDLFGPPCRRLDRHTRTVKLAFDRPSGDLWEREGELRVLPLEFEGSFDMTFTCDLVDGSRNLALVMLCFDPDTDGGYVIVPGVRDDEVRGRLDAACKLVRVGGGEPVTIGFESHERETGLSAKVSISRRGKSFTVKFGGKKILAAKDDTYTSGYVALRGKRFLDITLSGRLEKRFLRRFEGSYHAERFALWEKESYDRKALIPEWLLRDGGASARPFGDLALVPSDAPGGKLGERLELLVEEALGGREAPESAALPEGVEFEPLTQALLTALASLEVGNAPGALRLANMLIEHEPDFVVARAVRGMARYATRDLEGAHEDLAFVCETAPAIPMAHQTLALVELYGADLPAAAKTIRRAVSLGHGDETTRLLETWIVRAERGPQWTRRFDHETKHFIVSSDHGKKMCFETATALEKMRKRYAAFLGEAPAGTPKSRVYVFAGRDGYIRYAGDLGINLTWTAGVYLPLVRELALWVPEVTADLENTVRHEGFHQYLHIFAEGVPPWFNEGMAQVFGDLSGETDRPFDRMPSLRRRVIPVKRLFALSQAEFVAPTGVALHYAQSVRVCRVMRADKELSAVLDAYRDGLLAGRAHDALYAEVLAPVLPAIQRAFDKSFD